MLLLGAISNLTLANLTTDLGLNLGGWIFISLAWISIISIAIFCFSKVIGLAEAKKREASRKALEWAALSEEERRRLPRDDYSQ